MDNSNVKSAKNKTSMTGMEEDANEDTSEDAKKEYPIEQPVKLMVEQYGMRGGSY